MTTPARFGPRLRKVRRLAGVSIREMALRLGRAPSGLVALELGRVAPFPALEDQLQAVRVVGADPVELVELAALDRGHVQIATPAEWAERRALARLAVAVSDGRLSWEALERALRGRTGG